MDRIDAVVLLGRLITLAWDVELGLLAMDVAKAYTPGWSHEWPDEGIVEAINVLTSAIFGTE